MRLSPMCAQYALPFWTRHTAMVARGRVSSAGWCRAARRRRARDPAPDAGSRADRDIGSGVCQKDSSSTLSAVSAARAIGMAAHAVDDHQQRRLLGDRDGDAILVVFAIPSRLKSAYSIRKGLGRDGLINCRAVYSTPQRLNAAERSERNDSQHDRFRPARAPGAWGTLVCELRSVNHRYLERLRLPEELRALDNDVRRRPAACAARSTAPVSARRPGRRTRAASWIRTALTRVAAALRAGAARRCRIAHRGCRRRPALARRRARTSSGRRCRVRRGRTLFQQTLEDLSEMRLREGKRIRELLRARCASLDAHVRAGAQRACRKSRRACARASRAHRASSRRRSIPSAWNRNWCCSLTRWTSTRSSTGSAATSRKSAGCSTRPKPAGAAWTS